MNKNLITIGVFATLIVVAFGYIVFDFLKPEDELVDNVNLPTITVLDVDCTDESRGGKGNDKGNSIQTEEEARAIIDEFAMNNGLNADDYPYYLISRMVNNPELTDFVLNYPLNRNANTDPAAVDVTRDIDAAANGVPLFLQWDSRWGYTTYGSDLMGLTGCGPTCLSMVSTYLLEDSTKNPLWMAQYSMENGYYDYSNNSGTLWSLMTDGARDIGLTVNEVPGEEEFLREALTNGHPVIAIMGPGDFTSEGHFIVITGYCDGLVTVNDPNSINNSLISWPIETILEQANGMWEYSI